MPAMKPHKQSPWVGNVFWLVPCCIHLASGPLSWQIVLACSLLLSPSKRPLGLARCFGVLLALATCCGKLLANLGGRLQRSKKATHWGLLAPDPPPANIGKYSKVRERESNCNTK